MRDGGSKVTGYVVEKKQAGSDYWLRVNASSVFDGHCHATDLIENAEYEFRVKAVNKAGESEPSSTTGNIKITAYPSKKKATTYNLFLLRKLMKKCSNNKKMAAKPSS